MSYLEKDPKTANEFLVTSLPTTIVYNSEIVAVIIHELGVSKNLLKRLKYVIKNLKFLKEFFWISYEWYCYTFEERWMISGFA